MRLVVGRIGRAHGIHGEVTVEVRTDRPDQRFAVGSTLITDPETRGPLTISRSHDHSGTLLLGFKEVTDRNHAEELRNTLLLADIDTTESNNSPDTFHITQIVGCSAVDGAGNLVGTIVDVLALPAHDTLVIDRNGDEMLVPFVKAHVPQIDLGERKITIANFEELQ